MTDNNRTMVSLQTLLEQNDPRFGTRSEISRTLTGKSESIDHDTKVLINMIFARFHHIYTHRFESAYADETTLMQAKREWALSLSGISPQWIEHALERCKKEHAWPPTIAEFLKLAQPAPESIGLPSVSEAYQEACHKSNAPVEHQWSQVCVQLAARNTGYFLLRSEPERISRPLFEKAYLALVNRLLAGETLEMPISVALPEPDFSAERELVQTLVSHGLNEPDAQNIAYYMEKPTGSEVRKRYRERASVMLEGKNIEFELPE
ncbi:MAG: replication protein P [Reinekea sp.]